VAHDPGIDAAIQEVLRAVPERRRDVLAHGVVEYGPAFVAALSQAAADLGAAADPTAAADLATVAGQAGRLLTDWLGGDRITWRADEGERRIVELKRQAATDPDDTVVARLAADAILRLPAGHELRDVGFARDVLLGQMQRARRPGGDVNDLLVPVFYLLQHDLVAPEAFGVLVDGAIAAATGRGPDQPAPHPAAVRDMLEAAHNYCIRHAADAWEDGGEQYAAWMGRARRLLDVAADERYGIGLGPKLAAMRARQLDVADEAQQAAAAYAEFLDAAGPHDERARRAALSEATLRLQAGEYQHVLDRLQPLAGGLLDRYLTAVTETDIADAGFAYGRAAVLMTSALIHLDRAEAGVCLIDTAKSARLRYRAALRQHPAQAPVLELERAILAASRSGSSDAPRGVGREATGTAQEITLRTRLQEQYRRLRPDLGDQVTRQWPVAEIAAVLAPDEAVIVLAALDDMTTISLITPEQSLISMTLRAWPWHRWDDLLDAPGGWRRLLAGRPSRELGADALGRVIATADRVIAQNIRELIDHAREGTRRLVIIPHRWLHLIPFWALPALDELPLSVFSSVDDLMASRSGAGPRRASGADRAGAAAPACLVVANPTHDLACSASEAQSAARLAGTLPQVLLAGPEATARHIADGLRDAAVFHFSGHAYSDHADPDRSALLVAPAAGLTADPFPAWVASAARWRPSQDGWRAAEVPGAGRLWERGDPAGDLERRMERGSLPTLYARYARGQLRRLGEEWSAGDILAAGQDSPCEIAFLSACSSGTAGGRSSYVDEYGGLPAALRLGGVSAAVCSLWEVDEGLAALFADLFYEYLAGPGGLTDPVAAARRAGHWLRGARKAEALERLDRLADQVRRGSPRAAMILEAYRFTVAARPGDIPYQTPWDWAAFYAVGERPIRLGGREGPGGRGREDHDA
jgi:CHAT domain-containing protein